MKHARKAAITVAAAATFTAISVGYANAATTIPVRATSHAGAPTTRAASAPCEISYGACISLSRQQAWFIKNGRVAYGPVSVATGRAGLGTPAGTFSVQWKAKNWYSAIYHASMPYSVFFHGGDALHAGSVNVKSHGCVHLPYSAAVYFFNNLNVGTTVQVVR